MARYLGCQSLDHSYPVLLEWVVNHSSSNEPCTFLIDEADCLTPHVIEPVRYLCDETGTAAILFGSEILEQTFASPRSGAYLQRLSSRIATKSITFNPLDVTQLTLHILKPSFGELTKTEASKFLNACGGNWRRATDLAAACQDIMQREQSIKLSAEIIQRAATGS